MRALHVLLVLCALLAVASAKGSKKEKGVEKHEDKKDAKKDKKEDKKKDKKEDKKKDKKDDKKKDKKKDKKDDKKKDKKDDKKKDKKDDNKKDKKKDAKKTMHKVVKSVSKKIAGDETRTVTASKSAQVVYRTVTASKVSVVTALRETLRRTTTRHVVTTRPVVSVTKKTSRTVTVTPPSIVRTATTTATLQTVEHVGMPPVVEWWHKNRKRLLNPQNEVLSVPCGTPVHHTTTVAVRIVTEILPTTVSTATVGARKMCAAERAAKGLSRDTWRNTAPMPLVSDHQAAAIQHKDAPRRDSEYDHHDYGESVSPSFY